MYWNFHLLRCHQCPTQTLTAADTILFIYFLIAIDATMTYLCHHNVLPHSFQYTWTLKAIIWFATTNMFLLLIMFIHLGIEHKNQNFLEGENLYKELTHPRYLPYCITNKIKPKDLGKLRIKIKESINFVYILSLSSLDINDHHSF